jgi:hypothetical protein
MNIYRIIILFMILIPASIMIVGLSYILLKLIIKDFKEKYGK